MMDSPATKLVLENFPLSRIASLKKLCESVESGKPGIFVLKELGAMDSNIMEIQDQIQSLMLNSDEMLEYVKTHSKAMSQLKDALLEVIGAEKSTDGKASCDDLLNQHFEQLAISQATTAIAVPQETRLDGSETSPEWLWKIPETTVDAATTPDETAESDETSSKGSFDGLWFISEAAIAADIPSTSDDKDPDLIDINIDEILSPTDRGSLTPIAGCSQMINVDYLTPSAKDMEGYWMPSSDVTPCLHSTPLKLQLENGNQEGGDQDGLIQSKELAIETPRQDSGLGADADAEGSPSYDEEINSDHGSPLNSPTPYPFNPVEDLENQIKELKNENISLKLLVDYIHKKMDFAGVQCLRHALQQSYQISKLLIHGHEILQSNMPKGQQDEILAYCTYSYIDCTSRLPMIAIATNVMESIQDRYPGDWSVVVGKDYKCATYCAQKVFIRLGEYHVFIFGTIQESDDFHSSENDIPSGSLTEYGDLLEIIEKAVGEHDSSKKGETSQIVKEAVKQRYGGQWCCVMGTIGNFTVATAKERSIRKLCVVGDNVFDVWRT